MDEIQFLAIAEKLNKREKTDTKKTDLILPIDKIDDLSVRCSFINLHKYNNIVFSIIRILKFLTGMRRNLGNLIYLRIAVNMRILQIFKTL
jgi:hypothetical protein